MQILYRIFTLQFYCLTDQKPQRNTFIISLIPSLLQHICAHTKHIPYDHRHLCIFVCWLLSCKDCKNAWKPSTLWDRTAVSLKYSPNNETQQNDELPTLFLDILITVCNCLHRVKSCIKTVGALLCLSPTQAFFWSCSLPVWQKKLIFSIFGIFPGHHVNREALGFMLLFTSNKNRMDETPFCLWNFYLVTSFRLLVKTA